MLWAIRSEVIRQRGEVRYYGFNYLSGVVLNLILFAGIYFAVTRVSGADGVNVFNLLVAYLVWHFAAELLNEMSVIILEESMLGTLEQIYISPTPLYLVLLARAWMSLGKTAIFVIPFLAVALLALNLSEDAKGLEVASWLVIVGLCIIALIATAGLGLALFGLSILFKRIGATKAILDYLLLVFSGVFIPVGDLPPAFKGISSILPYTWALESLRLVITERLPASTVLSRPETIAAVTTAGLYLVGGMIVAKWCLYVGRKRGSLSHY